MLRAFLSLVFCLSLASGAFAQAFNPYAAVVEEPPVREDGKLNWPKFFKSAALHNRFQTYFAMGSCVGTRKEINDMLANNELSVNALPEGKIEGRTLSADANTLTMVGPDGNPTTIVTHPAGVSKVSVTGQMHVLELQPGMLVRALAKVNANGICLEKLEALEVVTPGPGVKTEPKAVEANKLQAIIGTIVKLHDDKLTLKITTGRIRKVIFTVDGNTQVDVNASSLALAGPGDKVEASGHLYKSEGKDAKQTVFAAEVTVVKRMSAEQKKEDVAANN
jgi:hypothetical protein